MATCTALSRRVEHLELDKIAQALEITKLKRRVKKLERRNKVKMLKLKRLQKVGTTQRVETSDETMIDDVSNQGRMIAKMDQDIDVVLEEAKEVAKDAKVDESVDIQGRKAESQAEIYKIDLEHANKVLSMHEDESEPAEVQEVVEVVTTAKIIIEVVTATSETITAASITITVAEAKVHAVTFTAAPSRRRKGVTKEQIEEEESRALKMLNETLSEKAAKRQKLDEEVEELKRHLQIVPNEDDDFPDLLRNFDREDLEALWSLVKKQFSTTNPKNFSDDFLLMTLGAMFEKLDIYAQVWKNQQSVHGPAKVKGWKLLESCELLALELMLLKEFKKKHAKCLMLLVKDLVLPSQVDVVD
uniref:Uncharacterized protein n=1 Tax=Tanacetum cinerariifolium TaxID=118510 RepID=A0A699K2Q4_TANCI|nr:hypothetical protein [Tanacetum cinerariifolium]